jgi:hypothetical protein
MVVKGCSPSSEAESQPATPISEGEREGEKGEEGEKERERKKRD